MNTLYNARAGTAGRAATPLARSLEPYDPISLSEMDNVRLMNRTDTKFVMSEAQALAALAECSAQYRVLTIDGRRTNHYQTLYFDTADWLLFRQHHAGAGTRYKVRSRAYIESSLAFLEVKRKKTVSRRTVKNRLRTPDMLTGLEDDATGFVRDYFPYDIEDLETRLWNTFTRVTLVSKVRRERLTLDFDVRFQNDQSAASLHGIVIAEVKQEGLSRDSDWMLAMRKMGVRPTGFSKYCVGVSLLYPEVKSNHFKPKLLLIERLLQGEGNHVRYH